VFETDPAPTLWSRGAVRLCDHVLLVAPAGGNPRPGDAERALLPDDRGPGRARCSLVLVHPEGTELPLGTSHWLEPRRVDDHHHVRWNEDRDFARLARALDGRSIGLVLGGGGARGLAHIGVLRALHEARIPVDAIGGTSMGATIAAQHAMGWSPDAIAEMNRRIFLEVKPHRGFRLPLLSLVNSRRPEYAGKLAFRDVQIEDLWVPYFSVSSNLTTAEALIHRRGALWKATLASASLPGVGTPVLHGNHLLVDGALLNNVPSDVMRAHGAGTVIASSVSVENDSSFTCDRVPTTWEALRSQFFRREGGTRFPLLGEVLLRSSLLHSTYRERVALEEADFALRPPVDEYRLMDFPKIAELDAVGYAHTRDAVRRWPQSIRCTEMH